MVAAYTFPLSTLFLCHLYIVACPMTEQWVGERLRIPSKYLQSAHLWQTHTGNPSSESHEMKTELSTASFIPPRSGTCMQGCSSSEVTPSTNSAI